MIMWATILKWRFRQWYTAYQAKGWLSEINLTPPKFNIGKADYYEYKRNLYQSKMNRARWEEKHPGEDWYTAEWDPE
jgi:hypothetical protein